jgi:hypothetical protein
MYRVFKAQADWTLTHTIYKNRTEHKRSFYNTRWRNTDWLTDQVITEWITFILTGDTAVSADKMFWTSNKPAQWTYYMYVCMYVHNVCMYVYMYVCMYARIYSCMCVYMCVCVCTYVYMYVAKVNYDKYRCTDLLRNPTYLNIENTSPLARIRILFYPLSLAFMVAFVLNCLYKWDIFWIYFNPEDGDRIFLRNVGIRLQGYTV